MNSKSGLVLKLLLVCCLALMGREVLFATNPIQHKRADAHCNIYCIDQLTYFINLSEDSNFLEEIVVVGYELKTSDTSF